MRFRPGDVVEVRSGAEIRATLDDGASVDGMPFMPEMAQFAGQRFTVAKRAEKICDTVEWTSSSRRLRDTVLLDDLRCDGSAHGGCQAGCRIYWNESWLRPVAGSAADPAELLEVPPELIAIAATGVRPATPVDDDDDGEIYRCQATAAHSASEQLARFDVQNYAREILGGNVGPVRFALVAAHAVGTKVRQRMAARQAPAPRPSTRAAPPAPLNLQPGELVQVRSHEEIAATLDDAGKNRGLWFDREMVPFCGGRYRVKARVQRIVNETTGRMIKISRDCIVLDNVVCSGEDSPGRWFCPRATYAYWREEWLTRVEEPATPELIAPARPKVLATL